MHWHALRISAAIPERDVTFRPIQVQGDGYASSDACRACHPGQYESWRDSFHRTMTQAATLESVRPAFENQQIDLPGQTVALAREGDQFWAEFDDPDAPRSRVRIRRQVVMVTGSHHQQVFWYRTNRGRVVGQLPAMYVIDERLWIPRASAFLRSPLEARQSETGRWNGVCINCHATHGKWQFTAPLESVPLARQHADTTTVELGIGCEACHGPAERHARLNVNPLRRYASHLTGTREASVIQPARLDPKRSSQVCGQCHSVWKYNQSFDAARTNTEGLLYRPGDELNHTRFVLQPAIDRHTPAMKNVLARDPAILADSFWPDGMIRVSGREYNGLIDSPCYAQARDASRTMTCFSCHAMHKPEGDVRANREWAESNQLKPRMDTNEGCVQCHAAIGADVSAHTKHGSVSSGSQCYNCHMPHTTYGLLRALRSHQVSSPSIQTSLDTGRPNACNLCHLDKTLAWSGDWMRRWYGHEMPALTDDQKRVAASVLWLLRGDAGQRALVGWSMGWAPAQQASGTAWLPPFLSALLDDPYHPVRYVAGRSLRSLPGYEGIEYDFVAPSAVRLAAVQRILDIWRRTRPASLRYESQLLFEPGGGFQIDVLNRIAAERDDRRIDLRE